jgi:hypothetical protein
VKRVPCASVIYAFFEGGGNQSADLGGKRKRYLDPYELCSLEWTGFPSHTMSVGASRLFMSGSSRRTAVFLARASYMRFLREAAISPRISAANGSGT